MIFNIREGEKKIRDIARFYAVSTDDVTHQIEEDMDTYSITKEKALVSLWEKVLKEERKIPKIIEFYDASEHQEEKSMIKEQTILKDVSEILKRGDAEEGFGYGFEGEEIPIESVLNKKITILKYEFREGQFKYLGVSIEDGGQKKWFESSSSVLQDQFRKLEEEKITPPFTGTIVGRKSKAGRIYHTFEI